MIAGIDASNLRAGGGITHLAGLLGAASPERHGFSEVRVWTPAATAAHIAARPWLKVSSPDALQRGLARRVLWQSSVLPSLARACDVLFVPGGSAPYRHRRLIAMSQNMLLFDEPERSRYGVSRVALRLALLARAQRATYRRAAGMVFLTRYAEREVRARVSGIGMSRVISHGINETFRITPRPVRPLAACSREDPLRIVYVSIVDLYKHQWHVVDAVTALRRMGLPLHIRFVGPAYRPALARLQGAIAKLDPDRSCTEYVGEVPYAALPEVWRDAELCVFASSCENQPNILLEAMAAGMPIACSHRGPMPEVLGEAGVYFDPENPESIARAIERLARDGDERQAMALAAHERSASVTWARCSAETFTFLAETAHEAEMA